MRIFHIATVADWQAALLSGSYATSTRGRTLAEEGFIHASRGDQWQGVRERFYADVEEPLLLLVIDTDRLTAPVVEETVADSSETFPHVYGAIDVGAVVQTVDLPSDAQERVATPSFSRLFFDEMFFRVLVAAVVLVLGLAGGAVGLAVEDRWGPLTGAVVGVLAGLLVARVLVHRRGK